MLKKRDLVSKVMDYSGLLNIAICNNKRTANVGLIILAYHRIVDYAKQMSFDFDEELISATTEDFEKQIKWCKNNFNITSFGALQKGECEPNSLIITFDDGYMDNYTNAFSILKKYAIPATIFLTTSYIGERKLLWWDEIAHLIKSTQTQQLALLIDTRSHSFPLRTKDEKRESIKNVLRLLKNVSDKDRIECMKQIRSCLNDVSASDNTGAEMLIWEQVKEMSSNEIEFGAHSVSHPVLSQLSSEQIYQEIADSKEKIESELNKTVTSFSYPVGGVSSYNSAIVSCVKKAGYKYAVTYIPGPNVAGETDFYQLKRIHVEKDESFSVFKAKVIFPGVIRY